MSKLEEYEMLSKNKYSNYINFVISIGLIFYHPIWCVVTFISLLFISLSVNMNSKLYKFLKANVTSTSDYEAYSLMIILKNIIFWMLYLVFVYFKLNVLACILVLLNSFIQMVIEGCVSDLIKKDLKNESEY